MIGNGKYETAMVKFLFEKKGFADSLVLMGTAFQIDELDRTIRSDTRTLADRLNRFAEEETICGTPPTLSTLVNDINVNTALLKSYRSNLYELIRAHFGSWTEGVAKFMSILSETV